MDVTFKIDTNGILVVTAKDVHLGHSKSLTITSDKLNLPKQEIARLVERGEFERDREARRKSIQAANQKQFIIPDR